MAPASRYNARTAWPRIEPASSKAYVVLEIGRAEAAPAEDLVAPACQQVRRQVDEAWVTGGAVELDERRLDLGMALDKASLLGAAGRPRASRRSRSTIGPRSTGPGAEVRASATAAWNRWPAQ